MFKEKKKKKSFIINTVFLVLFAVLIFTPLGTSFKVWVNQLVAMSPSLENKEDFQKVDFGDWKLVDENGNDFNLNELKDKVVVINFWATWCPPCIAEKPSFQELYNDYKNKVVFMFVTTDSPEKVEQFKTKYNYTLPVYYQKNDTPTMLYSSSIPASFVLNKEGEIVIKKFRAADWNSAKFRVILDNLLEEK